MNDLLDIIRWNVRDPYRRVLIPKKQKDGTMRNVAKWELRPEGEGVVSLTGKTYFVEHAVLCGFQAAQRLAGVTERSPDFVVDVRMSRKHKGKKLAGWHIQRKDGRREFVQHDKVVRKKWKPEKVTS